MAPGTVPVPRTLLSAWESRKSCRKRSPPPAAPSASVGHPNASPGGLFAGRLSVVMLSGKNCVRRDACKNSRAPRRATGALLGVRTRVPRRLRWERRGQRFTNRGRLQLPPVRPASGSERPALRRRVWPNQSRAREAVAAAAARRGRGAHPRPNDFAAVLARGGSPAPSPRPKAGGSEGLGAASHGACQRAPRGARGAARGAARGRRRKGGKKKKKKA
ncbi:uncharacterized protein LOC115342490 [Aquila chrysaetos chrysaetos]|uniref:uncharacterized protein LOC115342490 n=1 Tax=Aquila chrysaetos chrysaetos TaxID=223781 RepID=UPI0011768168|nr:uncharacterized protein LOC115342490 [Aquila chrysaetos chrysaetos]